MGDLVALRDTISFGAGGKKAFLRLDVEPRMGERQHKITHVKEFNACTNHWPLLESILFIPLRKRLDDRVRPRAGLDLGEERLFEGRFVEGAAPSVGMSVDAAP